MPITKKIDNKVFCWKNTETLEELINRFQNFYKIEKQVFNYQSQERKKQLITTNLLVQEVLGDYSIVKKENGKPYLQHNKKQISFSHNKDYTVLMVSNKPCGVDIHKPTNRIVKLSTKFINEEDFCVNTQDIELLSTVWACKEAVFKQFGEHSIFLKSNIFITEQISNSLFRAKVRIEEKEYITLVKKEIIENNYLLYTI